MSQPGFHTKASDKEQQERRRTEGTIFTRLFARSPLVLALIIGALVYVVVVVATQN